MKKVSKREQPLPNNEPPTLPAILAQEELCHLLEKFDEQGITVSILADLTDADLRELGIQKLGERKRLLAAFSKIKVNQSPVKDDAGGREQKLSGKAEEQISTERKPKAKRSLPVDENDAQTEGSELLIKLAKNGDSKAALTLGELYEAGNDIKQAEYWYKMGAEMDTEMSEECLHALLWLHIYCTGNLNEVLQQADVFTKKYNSEWAGIIGLAYLEGNGLCGSRPQLLCDSNLSFIRNSDDSEGIPLKQNSGEAKKWFQKGLKSPSEFDDTCRDGLEELKNRPFLSRFFGK